MSHAQIEYEPQRNALRPLGEATLSPELRPRRAIERPLSGLEWLNSFLGGLGSGLFVQIIGYLSFLEIYLLVTLPVTFISYARAAFMPGVRAFTCFWALWVIGQIGSDIVNLNDFGYAARGFAKAFFSGFVTLALVPSMLRRPRMFEGFLAGLPLAHLIGAKYFRSGAYTRQDGKGWMEGDDLGWDKWGGYLCTLMLAYLVARFWRTRPWLCTLATVALGCVHIAMGSRSTGLYHILAAALMPLVIDVTRTSPKGNLKRAQWAARLPWVRFVAALFVLCVTAVVVKNGYEHYASTGAFGEKAFRKYQMQANQGNLIMSARQGPFIGIAAALEKPIMGHGSWARMDKNYLAAAADLFGFEFEQSESFNYHRVFIPSHSMIIAAWVEGGILGLLFWAYATWFVIRNLPRTILVLPDYAGVLLINSIGFFWSVLFSPIQSRNYTAMIMVPLLVGCILMRAQRSGVPVPGTDAPNPQPETVVDHKGRRDV